MSKYKYISLRLIASFLVLVILTSVLWNPSGIALADHYESDTESKDFTYTYYNVKTSHYDEDGNYESTSSTKPQSPDTWPINSDGYVGAIPKSGPGEHGSPSTTYWPNGNKKTESTNWWVSYGGTLTKTVQKLVPCVWGNVSYEAAHPHKKFHKCTVCGKTEYVTGYKTGVKSCTKCVSNYGTPKNSENTGDPVNIVTGNFYSTDNDLQISDIGDNSLEINRYYNSLDERNSMLGKTWRINYDSSLEEDNNTGYVSVIYPDGHTLIYEPIGEGEYKTPESVFDVLKKNTDGTFKLVLENKNVYTYNTIHKLSSIIDRNNNTINIQYDIAGNITYITGASGKKLTFNYENGKVKSVTDPIGRTIVYSYDGEDNLIQVKSIGDGITKYEYNTYGIVSITDQNNKKYIVNEYDADKRVVRQFDEDNNETRFIYDNENMENSFIQVTLGRTTRYKYNDKLYITRKTFTDATYEEYTYDQWGNRNSVRDRIGNTTNYTFDIKGNRTSITDALNNQSILTYDLKNNLTEVLTPAGGKTNFEYDSKGNLIKTIVKVNESQYSQTAYGYDSYGRLVSIEDPKGNKATYQYLSDKNPTKAIDAEGNETDFGYDAIGRRTSIKTFYGTTFLEYNNKDKVEKLTDPAGNITRLKYDARGNLIKTINPEQYNGTSDDGNGESYTYDGMDRLTGQIDPLNAVTALKYDMEGNKSKEINPNYYNATVDDGLGFSYQYNDNGKLVKVTNPSTKQSRYKYDGVGNLIKAIDANNYNSTTDDGPGIEFIYDALNRLTTVKDTNGNVTKRLVYDTEGKVIKEIDAKGYLSGNNDLTRYGTEYKYNLAGWLTEKRVPLKQEETEINYQITKYTFDLAGNILEQKSSQKYVTLDSDPDTWNTITYTYNKNGQVKLVTDNNGGNIEYTYDPVGNIIKEKSKISDSKDFIKGYEYNKTGNISKKWNEIDSEDVVGTSQGKVMSQTVMEYNKNGKVVKITSPEGYVTTYEYDSANRVVAKNEQVKVDSINLKNNNLSISSHKKTLYYGQQYNFDLKLNANEAISNLDIEIKYDSRLLDNISATSEIEGVNIDIITGGVIKVTATNVNLLGDLKLAVLTMKGKDGYRGTGYISPLPTSTWNDNASIQNQFTEIGGKLLSVKSADMNNSGSVETRDFTLTAREKGLNTSNLSFEEKYDIDGNGAIENADLDYIKDILFSDTVPTLTDIPSEKIAEKTSKSIYTTNSISANRRTSYEYDKAGNLTKEIDSNGKSTTYEYDAYNRVIKVINKEGGVTRYFYDEEGNIIKVVQPQEYNASTDDGNGSTYKYDTMNRLQEVKDANGTIIQKNTFDIGGMLTSTADANNYAVEYTYDLAGRQTKIVTPQAKLRSKVSASYVYDAAGYILSVVDGEGNTTNYERDMWGRATRVTDPNGTQTLYTYDYMGNLTSSKDGRGNITEYNYNSLNKISSIKDPAGKIIAYKYNLEGRLAQQIDRAGKITKYDFNSDGNITQKTVEGSEEYQNYLYNKDGSLLAAINNAGTNTYKFTPNGLLQDKIRNGRQVLHYEYNKNGNITNIVDGAQANTSYTYDTNGRIKTVSDGSTIVATYTYNPDGTIAAVDYNSGIKASYGYDKDKNVVALENKNASGTNIKSFSYTYDNNGNQTTKAENGVTTNYVYDNLNRLVQENNTHYEYDAAGNRLSKTTGADSTSYTYDALNKLTESTNNGIISTYDYDQNGNLKSSSDGTTYTYDAFNRAVEVNKADETWQKNIYDAEGLRVGLLENGEWSEFTFDRGSVIAEYDEENKQISRNIRGINLVAQKDKKGALNYYINNAHGDVAAMTDAQGNILNNYTYDAFGNTMSCSEKVANRFKYCGEQQDNITGQYYLRARYYDPKIGRFTQEDVYRGDGLNLYVYVSNNPVMFIDPNGYCKDNKVSTNTNSSLQKVLDDPNVPKYIKDSIRKSIESNPGTNNLNPERLDRIDKRDTSSKGAGNSKTNEKNNNNQTTSDSFSWTELRDKASKILIVNTGLGFGVGVDDLNAGPAKVSLGVIPFFEEFSYEKGKFVDYNKASGGIGVEIKKVVGLELSGDKKVDYANGDNLWFNPKAQNSWKLGGNVGEYNFGWENPGRDNDLKLTFGGTAALGIAVELEVGINYNEFDKTMQYILTNIK